MTARRYTSVDEYIAEVVVPALGSNIAGVDERAIAVDMLEWRDASARDGMMDANHSGFYERGDVTSGRSSPPTTWPSRRSIEAERPRLVRIILPDTGPLATVRTVELDGKVVDLLNAIVGLDQGVHEGVDLLRDMRGEQ